MIKLLRIVILLLIQTPVVPNDSYSTIIYKNSRSREDPRQALVQEAYDIWWMDHIILLECENTWWDYKMAGDWWHAIWLCQANDRRHKLPSQFYIDPHFQVQYCYELRQWWTLFYWPQRPKSKTDAEKCWSYSKKYFTILTWQHAIIRTNSDES